MDNVAANVITVRIGRATHSPWDYSVDQFTADVRRGGNFSSSGMFVSLSWSASSTTIAYLHGQILGSIWTSPRDGAMNTGGLALGLRSCSLYLVKQGRSWVRSFSPTGPVNIGKCCLLQDFSSLAVSRQDFSCFLDSLTVGRDFDCLWQTRAPRSETSFPPMTWFTFKFVLAHGADRRNPGRTCDDCSRIAGCGECVVVWSTCRHSERSADGDNSIFPFHCADAHVYL